MIELREVTKEYSKGVAALNGINLKIEQGEFVFIVGDSGSGKSTLIKLIMKELEPTSGTIIVNGNNLSRMKHRRVPMYRRNIGVVFQDYKLLPHLTVFENIAYALEVIGMKKAQIRKRTIEVMKVVGLSEKGNSFPKELSGGQQQRVAIARAIANRPKVLIADEPTGNLDPAKSDEIMDLLEEINQRYGTTVVMVTHDITLVNKYRKRTIVLEQGHIVADRSEGGYVRHD